MDIFRLFQPINPGAQISDPAGNPMRPNSSPTIAGRAAGAVQALVKINPFAPASALKPAAEGLRLGGAGVKSAGEGLGKAASAAGRGLGVGVFVLVVIVGLVGLAYFAPLLAVLRRS